MATRVAIAGLMGLLFGCRSNDASDPAPARPGTADTSSAAFQPGEAVVATAPGWDNAGNASLVTAHEAMWVVWENATADKSESVLRLLHTTGRPLADPWDDAVVLETAGQIKPSLAAGPDGVYLLANACGGDCSDVDFNRSQLFHHPAAQPTIAEASWAAPVDPLHDAGRGDVEVGSLGPTVCLSEQAPGAAEVLTCSALVDDAWTSLARIESGANADHPCTRLDDAGQPVVGFVGRVDGQRQARVRLGDGRLLDLSPGLRGGDVQLGLHDKVLQGAWWSAQGDLWTLHHGVCDTYPDCGTLDRWAVTDLDQGIDIRGVGLVTDGARTFVVWTTGAANAEVRGAWIGDDGTVQTLATGASTNQGQPILALADGGVWVLYTSEATGERPAELVLAGLPEEG